MKDSGKMTLRADRAPKNGQKALSTLGSMMLVRSRATAPTRGSMAPSTTATGTIIALMGEDIINGKTNENTSENGVKTTCTAWASTCTPMASLMKASIEMTRRLGMVYTSGRIAASTKVGGIKENSTVLAYTRTRVKVKSNMGYGSMGNE